MWDKHYHTTVLQRLVMQWSEMSYYADYRQLSLGRTLLHNSSPSHCKDDQDNSTGDGLRNRINDSSSNRDLSPVEVHINLEPLSSVSVGSIAGNFSGSCDLWLVQMWVLGLDFWFAHLLQGTLEHGSVKVWANSELLWTLNIPSVCTRKHGKFYSIPT